MSYPSCKHGHGHEMIPCPQCEAEAKLADRHKIAVRYETLYKDTRDELAAVNQAAERMANEADAETKELRAQLDAAIKERDYARGERDTFKNQRNDYQQQRDAALARAEAGETKESITRAVIAGLLASMKESIAECNPKDHPRTYSLLFGRIEILEQVTAAIDAATGEAKGGSEGEKPATWTPQQTWIGGEGGDV